MKLAQVPKNEAVIATCNMEGSSFPEIAGLMAGEKIRNAIKDNEERLWDINQKVRI